jgi:ankyrin repeat protein
MAGDQIDALFAAIENFSVEDVKRIIDEGVDLTHTDKLYHYTPLIYVVHFEEEKNIPIEILDAILASDTVPSFINMIDNDGKTALHHATDMVIINKLLEKGANLEAGNKSPVGTPLVNAAKDGKHKIMDILLGKRASLLGEDSYGKTALIHSVAEACHHYSEMIYARKKGYQLNMQTSENLYKSSIRILTNILTRAALLPAEEKSLVLDKFLEFYGETPLHTAVNSGSLEIVNLLLKAGANVNVGYVPASLAESNQTPLYRAAVRGDMDMVELLLSKGADTDAVDSNGQTPIYGALDNNRALVVKRLLEAGADVNTHDNMGYTPLLFALQNGTDLASVNELLAVKPDITVVDKDDLTALDYAIQNDYHSIITKVVEMDKLNTVNIKGDTYLLQWLKGDAVLQAAVKELLTIPEVDITVKDAKQATALHLAAKHGYSDIVNTLLEKGADMNVLDKLNHTPLMLAVASQKTEVVEILLEKGADSNSIVPVSGYTLISLAVMNNDIRTVEEFLKRKVQGKPVTNLNLVDVKGDSPLLLGIKKGVQPLIIQLLLDNGADVNLKNLNGSSPLHTAVALGDVASVSIVLTYSPDVNSFTNFGLTPLMAASENLSHLRARPVTMILNMLIDAGADINLQDSKHGLTALHFAIDNGNYMMIKGLLNRFADPSIKAKDGQDVYQVAKDARDKTAIDMLNYYKPRWKGVTQSDVEKLDIIFDTKAANYATCPVCVEYVERSEACMYMKHKCKESGGYFNSDLFDKYANPEGYVGWCTICGRIAIGHRHYMLSPSTEENPVLGPGNGAPFELDCRLTNGGGGIPEKLARFRALREYILKMKENVGKLSKVAVLNGLVEEMWNAPLGNKEELKKLLRAKAWNDKVSADKFAPASASAEEEAPSASSDIPFTGTLPTVIASGHNNVSQEDDIEVLQFTHLQKDGTTKVHSISAETLEGFVEGVIGDAERFGMCFMYPGSCDSRLHSAEIEGHIPEELYERYKGEFNRKFEEQVKFKFMEGGAGEAPSEETVAALEAEAPTSIFNEAEDAVCVEPVPTNKPQQGGKKRKSTRKNRKNTTRRPGRKSKASRKRK